MIEDTFDELFETILWEGQRENVDQDWAEEVGSGCGLPENLSTGKEKTTVEVEAVLEKLAQNWPVTGGLQYVTAAATVKSVRQRVADLFIPILSRELASNSEIDVSWAALLVFFMAHDAGNQQSVIYSLTTLSVPQSIIYSVSRSDATPRLVRAVSKMLSLFFEADPQDTFNIKSSGKNALLSAAQQYSNMPLILSEIFESLSNIKNDLTTDSEAALIQTCMTTHHQSEGLLLHLSKCCDGMIIRVVKQDSLLFIVSKYRSSDNVDLLRSYLRLLTKTFQLGQGSCCVMMYPLLCELLKGKSSGEIVVEILEAGFSCPLPAGKNLPPEDFVSISIQRLINAHENGTLARHTTTTKKMVQLLLAVPPGAMFTPACQDFLNFLSMPSRPLAKSTLSHIQSDYQNISNNPDMISTVYTLLSNYCYDTLCDDVVVLEILKVLLTVSFGCLNAFPYLEISKKQLVLSEMISLTNSTLKCCAEEASTVVLSIVGEQIKTVESNDLIPVTLELLSTLVLSEIAPKVVTFSVDICSVITSQRLLDSLSLISHKAALAQPEESISVLGEIINDLPPGEINANILTVLLETLSSPLVNAQSAPCIVELLLLLAPAAIQFPIFCTTLTTAVTAYPVVVTDIIISFVRNNPKAFSQSSIWSILEPLIGTPDCKSDLIVSIIDLLVMPSLSSSTLGAPALLVSILDSFGNDIGVYTKIQQQFEKLPKIIKNGEVLCVIAKCLLVNGKECNVDNEVLLDIIIKTIASLDSCKPPPPATGELLIVESSSTVLRQLLPDGCPNESVASSITSLVSLKSHPLLAEAWIYAFPESLYVAEAVITVLRERAITTESERENNDLNEQTKSLLQGFLLSVSSQNTSEEAAPVVDNSDEEDCFKKIKTEKTVRIICTLMKKFIKSAAIQEKGLQLLQELSTSTQDSEYVSHIPGTPDFNNQQGSSGLLTVIDVMSNTMSHHPSSASIVRGCASAILKYIHCVSPLNTRRLTTTLTNAIADHMHSERSVVLIMSALSEVVTRLPVLIRINVIQSAVTKYSNTKSILMSVCAIAESLIRCSLIEETDKQRMIQVISNILDSNFIREPTPNKSDEGRLKVITGLFSMISTTAPCGSLLKRIVADLGILPRIINLINKNNTSAEVAAAGCTALAQLSYDTPFITKELVEITAVTCVTKSMLNFQNSESVQIAACSALSGLAFNNVDGQQQILMQGGPQQVISALQQNSFSIKLLEIGCLVLGTLSWNDTIRQEVAALGGMSAVVEAMKRFPNEAALQKNGCRAMSQLAYNNNENRVILQSVGAVTVVLKALRLHSSNDRVVLHAIVALTYMSWRTDAVIHEIVEGDGLPLIEMAVQSARSQNNEKLRVKAEHLISILNRSTSESPSVGPSTDSPIITPGLFPLRAVTHDRCRDTRWHNGNSSPNNRWARQDVGMYS